MMMKENLKKDKNKMALDRRPSFFKICNELTEKRLRIPPKFVRDVLKKVPKRIILDGPSGGPWCTKVVKTADDAFLGHGWQKFVEDNWLQEYNFLLFVYDGATCFTVQIFEKNGLERDYTSAPRTHQEVAASCFQNLDPHIRHDHPRGRGRSIKHRSVFQDKSKSFYSDNPFFERLIKSYNVGPPFLMFVPKWFADKHFEKGKTKIKLTNSEDTTWDVNYTVNNGRFVFVGGWRSFARDNNLKIGNVCIFELAAEKVLQVHIF